MSSGAELREEIAKPTARLQEYEARSEGEPATAMPSVTVIETNNINISNCVPI